MTLAPHVPVVIVPKVTKLVEPDHVLTAVFSTLSSDKSVLTSVKERPSIPEDVNLA